MIETFLVNYDYFFDSRNAEESIFIYNLQELFLEELCFVRNGPSGLETPQSDRKPEVLKNFLTPPVFCMADLDSLLFPVWLKLLDSKNLSRPVAAEKGKQFYQSIRSLSCGCYNSL